MSAPDGSINNVLNFQPISNTEHHVDKTCQQIKRQVHKTRQDLFADFGLTAGPGPMQWMTTTRIAPVQGSGAGNGTEMPDDPGGYTTVNKFERSTANDVDESAQAIKRVLEALRKKLFKDNKFDENQWMSTIRIAPRDNVGNQDPNSCGCGT